jgi:hypothetical protein
LQHRYRRRRPNTIQNNLIGAPIQPRGRRLQEHSKVSYSYYDQFEQSITTSFEQSMPVFSTPGLFEV